MYSSGAVLIASRGGTPTQCSYGCQVSTLTQRGLSTTCVLFFHVMGWPILHSGIVLLELVDLLVTIYGEVE